MFELIGPESYLVYHKELEYMLAAIALLTTNHVNDTISKVYRGGALEELKRKNRQIFELFQSMKKDYHLGFFEFLPQYDLKQFTLDGYEKYLLSLSEEDFYRAYLYDKSKEDIRLALSEDKGKSYEQLEGLFSQYFTYEFFFEKKERVISMFFQLVRSMISPEVDEYLERRHEEILNERDEIKEKLTQKEPFAFTEELLSKICYHRGPYEKFYFMPSMFSPLLCCRITGKNQFLFYDFVRMKEKKVNVPEKLKVMSDNTRYRILILLKESGHLTGIDVAKKLRLATSTVSHHMNLLKDQGMINEESVGTTKYYSLNVRAISNTIKVLQDTFL